MAEQMDLPVLLINIDRAIERRLLIEGQAEKLGIRLERVAGIDGAKVPPDQWVDADRDLFLKRNGRPLMTGEYGCYKSHLKAFQQLVDSGAPAARIIEDDVALSEDLMLRAQSVAATVKDGCVVKLVNHRTLAFRHLFTTPMGDRIGLSRFGPQGSAACYLLTRGAAQKLLEPLRVQSLPFDMALERVWHHHVPVYTAEESLLEFGDLRSQTFIASRADYKQQKQKGLAKIPTHIFRVKEALLRAFQTLF